MSRLTINRYLAEVSQLNLSQRPALRSRTRISPIWSPSAPFHSQPISPPQG